MSSNAKNQLQEIFQKRGLPCPKYEPTSAIGPPHGTRVTVTWEGRELSEVGVASTRKEAGKLAAQMMLGRLQEHSGSAPQAASHSHSEAVSPGPSQNYKSILQELLQKNSYRVPTYDLLSSRGAAHKKEHTYACRVSLYDGGVLEKQASGSTKRVAENSAAESMLKTVQPVIETGGILSAASLPQRRQTPPPEVIDKDLDGDISVQLADYCPQFDFQTVEGGVVLCLARATSGCASLLPASVAAHGRGESESQAKREAALNLAHNLQELNFKLS